MNVSDTIRFYILVKLISRIVNIELCLKKCIYRLVRMYANVKRAPELQTALVRPPRKRTHLHNVVVLWTNAPSSEQRVARPHS